MKRRISFDDRMQELRALLQAGCKRYHSRYDLNYALCLTYSTGVSDSEWYRKALNRLETKDTVKLRTG